jgi:hypothetical protein
MDLERVEIESARRQQKMRWAEGGVAVPQPAAAPVAEGEATS